MTVKTPGARAARPTRALAYALTSIALSLLPLHQAVAQENPTPCEGAECPPAAEQGPQAAETPLPVADDTTDLVLPTVAVEAAAPVPEPAPSPAPRRAPAPVIAAPAPAVVAPAANPESRFAARPARVQERTKIGRLSVDTPLNGTALGREDLETVRSSSAETDLLLRVPGISMIRNIRIPTGGKGYTNNLIDGFSVRSQTLGSFGFLDDVNLWDVEAVEITRGPASVLYSSKAVGGTVNVISRTPPETQETEAFAEMGSNGFTRAGVNLAGPLGSSEELGYSFSLNKLDSDGWRDRSAIEKLGVSGKLVWAPSDRTELTFRAEYQDMYEEHPGRLTQEQFDEDWQQAQYFNLYEDKQSTTLSASLKHEFDANRRVELSYGFSNTSGIDACPAGCSSRIASLLHVEVDHSTHNLRALYEQDFAAMDGKLSLGVDAFQSTKKDDTYWRSTNSFTPTRLGSAYTLDETSVAPFAQYEFSPLEDLRLILGARYENYDLEVDDRSPYTDNDGAEHYSELVTKGGLSWEYAPDSILWASVAEGYFVPSTRDTVTDINARPLPPEHSMTYSVGLRGELMGGDFGYDLGLYHSTIRDQAVSLSCGGDATLCPGNPDGDYPVAAGKVRYQGIETTLHWRASDQWRFDLAHTYARNTYVDFVTDGGDFSGKTAPASPLHHANLRATYAPTEALDIELEADWISAYYTNESNTDRYKRPVLWNLRARYDVDDRVMLFGSVENLFDVKYAKRVSATNDPDPVRGYAEGYSERTFRFGLTARF